MCKEPLDKGAAETNTSLKTEDARTQTVPPAQLLTFSVTPPQDQETSPVP